MDATKKQKEPTASDAALEKLAREQTGFGKLTGKRAAETYQGDSVKTLTARGLPNARREKLDELPRSGCRTSDEAAKWDSISSGHHSTITLIEVVCSDK
jgi:hypothetical protein